MTHVSPSHVSHVSPSLVSHKSLSLEQISGSISQDHGKYQKLEGHAIREQASQKMSLDLA